MTSEPVIDARALTKRFGDFTAVDAIDVRVERGEAFGFLGPNGAGKSSTMRMVGAVSPPTEGFLRVLGRDPVSEGTEVRARLGVVPQEDNLDRELTAWENLYIYGRYFGLARSVLRERVADLLAFAELTERANAKTETLSGGMRRRLTIARALVNRPDMILLDEPTTGLDPRARLELWALIRGLVDSGTTVLLTTQYLDEADALADDIALIDHGRVIASGSPEALKARVGTRTLVVRPEDPAHLDTVAAVVTELAGASPEVEGGRVSAAAVGSDVLPAVVRRLDREGIAVSELVLRGASLDDVFLALTGQPTVPTEADDDH